MQVPLSHDHTAELDAERQRVLDAGGTVSRQRGLWRIGEIGLMVTR
jgi:Protein phosphatase 2C